LENINPDRIFVCASGVENHREFVELAEKTLGFMPAPTEGVKKPEKSHYKGGEVRIPNEDNELKIAIGFETGNWKSDEWIVLNVVNQLFGHYDSATKEKQKDHHARASKEVVNNKKYSFIESANSFNFTFSDSGLFGLALTGCASHGNDILNVLIDELKHLKGGVSKEELVRAKAVLKHHLYTAMER